MTDPIYAALERAARELELSAIALRQSDFETFAKRAQNEAHAARAALAEHRGEGPAVPESREPASVASNPSDRAIRQLYCDTFGLRSDPTPWAPPPVTRAVLARWGHQPAPELGETAATAAEGEVAELVAWLNEHAAHLRKMQEIGALPETELHESLDRAAELLQQQQAEINRLKAQQTPVPVSERLPGPEDLSAKLKFCWWWNCMLDSWAFCDASYCDHSIYTHWRPAHALPLPEGEVE